MSLTQRVNDLKLAFKIWGAIWAIVTPAAMIAVPWLMSMLTSEWAWRRWMLASVGNFVGLGQVPIVSVSGQWISPASFLAWAAENIPAAMLADWASDLRIIAFIPLGTAAMIIVAGGSIHMLNQNRGSTK